MIYKYIGNTGVKIPAIAQGTTGIGSYGRFNPDTVKERITVLKNGIDLGLTFLDTAELYGGGFVEEIVGEVITGIRDKIFLATKFNPKEHEAGSVFNSIENSLRRLKTDYIDLYQIHWPNPKIPIDEIMKALFKLTEMGKIRFVGVSNFSLGDFKSAQAFFNGKIVSNQVEYNLLDRSVENDFLPYCISQKVTLLAYSPLNQGRLFFDDVQEAVLVSMAKKYNKSVAQIVLRWLIEHVPVVAVTKTKNIDHLKENAASAEFDLETEDLVRITNFSSTNFIEVPTDKIRLCAINGRPVYTTIAEAKENRLDLIPSPINLAEMFKQGDFVRPIRLKPTKDATGKFLYDIDNYDTMDHVKKYWAWIIAFGNDKPIPAFILADKSRHEHEIQKIR